jgi:hypothetical protein
VRRLTSVVELSDALGFGRGMAGPRDRGLSLSGSPWAEGLDSFINGGTRVGIKTTI